MNRSKTGLNEPFYRWLDEVRRAIRKEKELKEKLAYYNVKLIGYKGVVYDRIGSAGTAGSDRDLYYWMDRIKIIEKKLEAVSQMLDEYQNLLIVLDDKHREVIQQVLLWQTATIKRSSYYDMLNDVIRMWSKSLNTNS